jgi:LacI family transcriptional regulator
MHVPDDIALVAYDDLDFGDVLEPSLTVMAQPVSEIASTAVDLLIRRITGKARTMDPQRVQIATTFIHRESCGCALEGSTGTMVGTSQRRAGRPLEASRL